MGIRAEESPKRAKYGRISKMGKWTIYKPIFEWSSEDVWTYIKKYKLPYCSLYDEGFTRLGCVVCPNIGGKKLKQHRDRFPVMYRILDKYLNELYHIQKAKGNLTLSYEEFMKWPDWKTKEQREYLQKQINML